MERGISAADVAASIGVPLTTVVDYEIGAERIPARHLCELSQHLRVPIYFFFDGLGATAAGHTSKTDNAQLSQRLSR
jgi:transcriptional regulator with XRE-family HTH domain